MWKWDRENYFTEKFCKDLREAGSPWDGNEDQICKMSVPYWSIPSARRRNHQTTNIAAWNDDAAVLTMLQ